MASKKYKGKTCAYCGREGASESGDHVIAREFFLIPARGDLPQVPACLVCNNEKSKLEAYATTVLPFGGQHASADTTLGDLVPQRLAKNAKLLHTLADGIQGHLVSVDQGPWQQAGTLPIDGEKLHCLFKFIVRGLAFFHWGLLFGDTHLVEAIFPTTAGQKLFEGLLSGVARERVQISLGDGAFVYEGMVSGGHPELTFWRMSFFGVELSAPEGRGSKAQHAYGVTGPRALQPIALLEEMFQRR